MSNIHNKNLHHSTQRIAADLTPYMPLTMHSKHSREFNKREDERRLLLKKWDRTGPMASSLNIPQTNFSELLNPKNLNPSKREVFFTRLSKSRIGKGFLKGLSWATSKGVMRVVNIIIPALAFAGFGALSGGMVPLAALVTTLIVTTYNILRDTKALRANKELEQEYKLLQEYKAAKSVELQALGLLKNKSGIDMSEPQIDPIAAMKSKFKSIYENDLTTRSLRKTIMDGLLEAGGNIATVAVVATSGLANAGMHAISVGASAGILTIVDIALTTRARRKLNIIKNAMRKEIDEMREGVAAYKSLKELKDITHRQKIKTEALRQVLKQDITELDKQTLQSKISAEVQIASDKSEFTIPVKPSFWKKAKQYFKDVNTVHWPNNDYYTPEKFAAKNDRDTAEIITKYSALSQEIHTPHKLRASGANLEKPHLYSNIGTRHVPSLSSKNSAGVTLPGKQQVRAH